MHTDEAVNAVIVGDMLAGQTYRYDPHDHHGPAFYYLTAPLCRALGARTLADMDAWQIRAGAALASSAILLLLGLLPEEASGATLGAALFFALGAPFVFYGRYAIHESLLVFATMLAVGAGWRFWRTARLRWAALAGFGLGLAECTKESAVATAAAIIAALAFCSWQAPTRRMWVACRAAELTFARRRTGAILAAAIFLAISLIFYSSMGRNPAGLRDAVRAFSYLSARAVGGAGHQKPWWTYLAWLARPTPLCPPWFGWLLLSCATAGAVRSFTGGRSAPLMRFFSLLSILLLVGYSATPYKTPWLMLNFLAPLAVVAGYGLVGGWQSLSGRLRFPAGAVAACLAGLLLARETHRLCFQYTDDPLNPYAYSPTSPDLERLPVRLDQLAATSPQGRNILIQVAADDYWPLPWYLRKFPRVGYWSQLPASLEGDVLVTSPDEAAAAEAALGPGWHREFFGLRADVLILLYTRDPPPRA